MTGSLKRSAGSAGPRVMFVAGTLGVGGAERQLSYMLRGLRARGIRAEVACFTSGEHWEERLRGDGVIVTPVGVDASIVRRLHALHRHVSRRRPQLLQGCHAFTNPYVALVAKRHRIPAIGALRTDPDRLRVELGRLTDVAFRLPDVLVANSRDALRKVEALGLDPSRLHLLDNAVDTEAFHPLDRSPGSVRTVIGVGRFIAGKRFDRWLRIFAEARRQAPPGVELRGRLFGLGPEQDALEALREELGLTEVVEIAHTTDIGPELQAADALLFTSDAIEGTPNVVMEAMATALPIVATDINGVTALISHGVHGLLASAGDDAGQVSHLLSVIEDPQSASAMGAAARQFIVDHRAIDAVGENLAELYDRLSPRVPSDVLDQ